jgi:hypothetical protein
VKLSGGLGGALKPYTSHTRMCPEPLSDTRHADSRANASLPITPSPLTLSLPRPVARYFLHLARPRAEDSRDYGGSGGARS